MKICIPTETNEGKAAKVYGHFGSAPYFTIYDADTNSVEVIDNLNQHHSHGLCHPMNALKGKGIDIVVCGGMGARAVQKLNEEGILEEVAISSGGIREEFRSFLDASSGMEEKDRENFFRLWAQEYDKVAKEEEEQKQ